MMSAITASMRAAAVSPAPRAPLTLDAQLARYQTQLSDCVNCESAKTPQGQQQIAEISSRIHEIKARMAAASTGNAPSAGSSPSVDYNSRLTRSEDLGGSLDTFA